jgi:hypothetical protein
MKTIFVRLGDFI